MLELWLLVALAILLAFAYKPLKTMLLGALDGHAEKVKKELEDAKALRDEAQALLAQHQRQLANGEEQAKGIIDHAEAEVRRLGERHQAELEAALARRRDQATQRIAQEEARALQELRSLAATLSVRATESLLRDHMAGEQGHALTDQAIREVGGRLT